MSESEQKVAVKGFRHPVHDAGVSAEEVEFVIYASHSRKLQTFATFASAFGQKKRNSKAWGFTLAIIGSACYGLNSLFALPLYEIGATPLCVLFYRYGISTVLLFAWMLLRK